MKEEVTNLQQMKTWVLLDQTPQMKVLKGTWAFRFKRTPDGVLIDIDLVSVSAGTNKNMGSITLKPLLQQFNGELFAWS